MIQICVLAIAGLFAALVIKKDKPEFAVLIIMLVSFFIAIRILTVLGNAVQELESWEIEPAVFKFKKNVYYYGFFLNGWDGYWYGFSNEGNSSGKMRIPGYGVQRVFVRVKKETAGNK